MGPDAMIFIFRMLSFQLALSVSSFTFIKTLYKRNYVTKVRKSLAPTPTGIELISLIREELLKSAELTGIWEKRLREIEARRYDAGQFMSELKQMVAEIVHQVLSDNTPRRIN